MNYSYANVYCWGFIVYIICFIREVNKAFCGFLNAPKQKQYVKLFQYNDQSSPPAVDRGKDSSDASESNSLVSNISNCYDSFQVYPSG